MPFLLEDVALDEDLFQEDGIHPTAAAQPRVLEEVWPHLQPLLGSSRTDFCGRERCFRAAALLYRTDDAERQTAGAKPGDPSWKRSG